MSTHDQNQAEPPLWSIGTAMLIILLAPLILYSFAPAGPIREGDTVFSNGQQRATFTTPIASQSLQPDETCLLDPNSPLIVLENSAGERDGWIKAEVQGEIRLQNGRFVRCMLKYDSAFIRSFKNLLYWERCGIR